METGKGSVDARGLAGGGMDGDAWGTLRAGGETTVHDAVVADTRNCALVQTPRMASSEWTLRGTVGFGRQ